VDLIEFCSTPFDRPTARCSSRDFYCNPLAYRLSSSLPLPLALDKCRNYVLAFSSGISSVVRPAAYAFYSLTLSPSFPFNKNRRSLRFTSSNGMKSSQSVSAPGRSIMVVFMAMFTAFNGIFRFLLDRNIIRFTEKKHFLRRGPAPIDFHYFARLTRKTCEKLKYWVLMALIDFNQSSAVELYRSYWKFRRIQYLFLLLSETSSGGKLPATLLDTSKTKIGRSGISIILNALRATRLFFSSLKRSALCVTAQQKYSNLSGLINFTQKIL